MTNIQAMVNAIGDAMRDTRSDYHVTLGELIAALDDAPDEAIVCFDDGGKPGKERSYRGYYSDLSFEDGCECETVSAFRDRMKTAFGSSYEGYKGGDFLMDERTPLWRSEYGEASGIAIINCSVIGGDFVLTCKQVED